MEIFPTRKGGWEGLSIITNCKLHLKKHAAQYEELIKEEKLYESNKNAGVSLIHSLYIIYMPYISYMVMKINFYQ